MNRRTFSREFKIEAVKLVTERGVAVAQACRDLDLSESVLRRWMRELGTGPTSAFPGHGRRILVRRQKSEAEAKSPALRRPI